ncbi:hypothetical protein BsWGS_03527 [Bradybaena similaris]
MSDGWLSKTHPPKSLLKRSAVVRQKGPLSRNTPPRAMLMKKCQLNLYASYLTQNSPPPAQLLQATKQSTLGDYFASIGDKVKTRIKDAPLQAKGVTPALPSCGTKEYQHEESFQMTPESKQANDEKSQPFQMTPESKQTNDETSQPFQMTPESKQTNDETSLVHSLYQSHTSNLPLTLHNSNSLEVKHMGPYGRDHVHCRQSPRTHKMPSSAMPSSDNYFRDADTCNKENCLHGCRSVCLFCRGLNKESTSTGDKSESGQGCEYQIINEKYVDIGGTEEFVTFSEGMKLLSQELSEYDSFSHSLTNQNHVWSMENACSHSRHTDSGNLEILSNKFCVTQDTNSQYAEIPHSFSQVKDIPKLHGDRRDISSLHTIRKQTRSPECVDDDSKEGGLEEFERVNDSTELTFLQSSNSESSYLRGCLLHHRAAQACETPDFVETSFTISAADTVSGAESGCSQLSILKGEQFQNRKQRYMSEFGTLVLSENI